MKPTMQILSGRLFVLFLSTTVLHGAVRVSAGQGAPKKLDDGVAQSLTTPITGWPLQISYFAPPRDEDAEESATREAAAVILLHDKGGNRRVWKPLANNLNRRGFAVITVDLRKHGGSRRNLPVTDAASRKPSELSPEDYKLMVLDDMEAVKNFLLKEHHLEHLNVRKTGIVGVGMSAPIAMEFARLDWLRKPYPDAAQLDRRTPKGQDIRAIVLISPEANLPRVSTNASTQLLKRPDLAVAFQVIYGEKDKQEKSIRDAERLFKMLTVGVESEERMKLFKHPSGLHGIELLGQRLGRYTVDDYIISFLEKNLKQLEDPWRSRKSRLE